jgi:homoaconitase/3-isopropylmalate dehydratase large subunit
MGRGISHAVMAEDGRARPGRIILGTDSHTVGLGTFGCLATGIGSTEAAAVMATGRIWLRVPETVKVVMTGNLAFGVSARDVALHMLSHFGPSTLNYKAIEFGGEFIAGLAVEERMAIDIMCLEMGVKNALMPADSPTLAYLESDRDRERIFDADADAEYAYAVHFEVSRLEPTVATPGLPTNGLPLGQVAGTRIDQAVIGSCAGAFYHDLVQAAEVVGGRKVHPEVRFIVVPNSSKVMATAARTGVLATLVEAGAIVSAPSCGPCAGYEVGCLAPGEVCISTTTRNMEGRMGPGGRIYLAASRSVAASALAGYIADPREYLEATG